MRCGFGRAKPIATRSSLSPLPWLAGNGAWPAITKINSRVGTPRGALSYRAARLAASIPNLAVEAKRPLLHYRSTAIRLSMIKCCELLCLDDAQHCLAIGRGRKG